MFVIVGGVVDDGRVVDVGHLGDVHRRTADVDPGHVCLAHVIRRHINFPRTQWKPSHIAAEATRTAADEDHQRGRIHCLHCHRTGHPAPASANTHPASVVERRVAPRRIIDPRPSPGRNPSPMACVIWRPADSHPVGEPDMAIVRIVAPVALVIQIVDSRLRRATDTAPNGNNRNGDRGPQTRYRTRRGRKSARHRRRACRFR